MKVEDSRPTWWERGRRQLADLAYDRTLWVAFAVFTGVAAAAYVAGFRDGARGR